MRRRLPDYFTDDVPEKVSADVRDHQGWVIVGDDRTLGFAVVDRRTSLAAEILWMAIDPTHRGSGVGTQLLGQVIERLQGDGVEIVEVKTLDRSAGYLPYESTRAFWERRGFVYLDCIDPLPGWPPGNPSAIYVAALRATR